MPITLAALGLVVYRPHHEAAADDRRRRPHAGHGARGGASGGPGAGARLCPAVPDGRIQGVHDGTVNALWALGTANTPAGTRPSAQAPLDALARAALCAGGQDGAPAAFGDRKSVVR